MTEENNNDHLEQEEQVVKPDYKFKQFVVHTAKYKTLLTKKFLSRTKYEIPDPKKIIAFIPGTIKKVHIKEGKAVKEGQILLVLEAMKMFNQVKSPFDGKIKTIAIKEGETVMKNQLLIEFE